MVSAGLDFRTELFQAMNPEGDELVEFRRLVSEKSPGPELSRDIYNCEFLGWMDDDRRKVGCLVHPFANDGKNLRDYAYYGAKTCGDHKCTAYNYLNDKEVLSVAAVLDDWYLYGLCVTDIDLVKGFMEAINSIRCETIDPLKLVKNEKSRDAYRKYLELKENWLYCRDRRRFGQYIFENGYHRVKNVDWEGLGMKKPNEYRILRSLGSELDTPDEARNALSTLRELFKEAAQSYGAVFV